MRCGWGVLAATPLLPLISSYQWSWGTPQAVLRVIPAYPAPAAVGPVPQGSEPVSQVALPPAPAAAPATSPAAPEALTLPPSRPAGPASHPWALALVIYASGCAALLGWIALGRWRLRRWVVRSRAVADPAILEAYGWACERLRLHRPCPLRLSDEVPISLAVGMAHPCILLPGGLERHLQTDLELYTLLLHEAAHVRRRDPLILGLAALARAVFFFHPLVWIAARRLARLAEHCADDAVLDAIDAPVPYAQMLVRLAETLPPRPLAAELATGILWGRGAFLERVEAILNRRGPLARLSLAALGFVLVLFAGACAVAALFPLGERGTRQDVDEAISILCVTSPYANDASTRIERTLTLVKKHPESETLPVLADWLGVQKDTKRRSALYILGELAWAHPEPVLEPVRRLTKHKEDTTRGMACLALGYLGDKASFDRVSEIMKSDSSPYAKRCAAFALGELDDPRALPLVEPMAKACEYDAAPGGEREIYDNAADAWWRLKWSAAYAGAPPAEAQAARGIWLIAGSTENQKDRLGRALALIEAADPLARRRVMERAVSFAPEKIRYLRNSSLVARALLTKKAMAQATEPPPMAKLPGGAVVTLLGVGSGGIVEKKGGYVIMGHGESGSWWSPAGAPVRKPEELGRLLWPVLQPAAGEATYAFWFETDLSDQSYPDRSWTFEVSAGGVRVVDSHGQDWRSNAPTQFRSNTSSKVGKGVVGVCLPSDVTTATLRLGVAAGEWETAAIYDVQKKDWIGLHDPALTIQRLDAKKDGMEIHYEWAGREKEMQVLAVTQDGTTHTWNWSNGGGNGQAPGYGFPGKPGEITRFQFRVRPYRWVSFRNVSLCAGLKTTVTEVDGK